jgi:hypothetical protein
MRQVVLVTILALVGTTFIAAPLNAIAGSTITGKVTYQGKSEEQEFLLSKWPNAKFCASTPRRPLVRGDKRILPTIEVDKSGGLKAAVVAITDIEDQAFMDTYKGTDVRAEFCEFIPFIGVVVKGKNFHVENHDSDSENLEPTKGVVYTAHLFEVLLPRAATVLNGSLVNGSTLNKPVVPRKVVQSSIFRLQCDNHGFMRSFFLPVTNPHYAVVNDDGTFEIKDVPAGAYKIMAWHPFVGETMEMIEVTEGGTTQIEIQMEKINSHIYSYSY